MRVSNQSRLLRRQTELSASFTSRNALCLLPFPSLLVLRGIVTSSLHCLLETGLLCVCQIRPRQNKDRSESWANIWPSRFLHSLPPVRLLMRELTCPCCWDFFNHFPRALEHLFLFTPCSRCGRMKAESPTLSLVTLLYRCHLRMDSKGKYILSAETRSFNSQCAQGSGMN